MKAEIQELIDFNNLLNTPPPIEEIKKDDSAGFEFLEISYIEDKLREIFIGMVEFNLLEWRETHNEVTAHVRITVTNPVNGRVLSYDGIASTEITILTKYVTVEKSHRYKLEVIEAPSLKLDLPKVYSLAIKNAAKKIGRAFGSDLNRHVEDEVFINPEQKRLTKEEEKILASENAVNNYRNLDKGEEK